MKYDYTSLKESLSDDLFNELIRRIEGIKELIEQKLKEEKEYVHFFVAGGSYEKDEKLKINAGIVKFTKENEVIKVSIIQ